MDCVNHIGVAATAYCQSCGKALCSNCVRKQAGGQILCDPCWTAWQSYQQPFVAPMAAGAPNPAAAAILGVIPGVGAMYNGQFFKGLIHVVIFAVLVSITDHYGIFGIFIAAWILYQSFEAFHTAKARRDGQPVPDPLGLNELGSWLNIGGRQHNWGQPGPFPGQGPMPGPIPGPMPGPGSAGPAPGQSGGYPAGGPLPNYEQSYTGPQPGQWSSPYAPPASGFVDPGAPMPPVPPVPPIPPMPPLHPWRRREPIGAVALIAMGALFLLGQFDLFRGRLFEFAWPLALIGIGAWLFLRTTGFGRGGQGGPK